MFDVYNLSTCKPHAYYLHTTCKLSVNCIQRFKQDAVYSVHKSHEQKIETGRTLRRRLIHVEKTIYPLGIIYIY